METIKRSCNCAELSLNNVDQEVTVVGWVSKRRNLGSLLFIDLRDRSGIVQICIKTDEITYPDIRNEYIIQVTGTVNKKEVPNKLLKTGEIEISAKEVVLINTSEQPPFIIADQTDALEETRLKYRYLDLRRPILQNNFILRAKIVKATHEFLDNEGFIEIETPYLSPSTPEGARDYLVPSRVHKGSFYALPQSPQLYKQMLMVAGFEKYYQIARCFRDEDLRADRQPDFTQIDIETSFLNQDEILSMAEGLIKKIFKDVIDFEVKLPLRRLTYKEAYNTYGSDKPDTRYDMKLVDIKSIFDNSSFELYKNSKFVKGIKVEGFATDCTRKRQDQYTLLATKFKLKSYHCFKFENDELTGSVVKNLTDVEIKAIIDIFGLNNGDVLFVACSDTLRYVNFGLGALRTLLANELNLIKPHTFDLLWVTEFPLFEKGEEDGKITSSHHPFTRPLDKDLQKLDDEPYNVGSYTYDIIINGYESGGGGLRIYDQNVQEKIFQVLGFTEEEIQKKFGFFVESLKYGTPPHGGLAFGLDRLTMILAETNNIRDVIAFPKNLSAVCPCTNAPVEVTKEQLDELGIKIIKE